MIEKKIHSAFELFRFSLSKYTRFLFEGIGTTILINFLALATSLFSMQVYDRVIPTHGLSTLATLSVGVIVMIIFEFTLKRARSSIMDNVVVGVDSFASRTIYKRLLSVRLDQMPASVGTLSSQLKSYETIRSFLTASTLYVFVDAPFAGIYIIILALIASPWIAVVSSIYFLIALIVGFWLKFKIAKHAKLSANYSNIRLGELVETVQGIEIIKAGHGESKFLSRWMRTSKATIANDLSMKHINEDATYIAALIQQLGYASIIIVGAYLVVDGAMTMGALIASSIISNRIMAPAAALPGLFSQMAHSKAALEGLEQMYDLKVDHHDITQPLKPNIVEGAYRVDNAEYIYNKTTVALKIENLVIKAGERVAILGTIGSGKSTLLKMLTGMYVPENGKLFLDNLDLSHIDRSVLTEKIGYMPQDNRLFQGTLKDNLTVGLKNYTDEELKKAAELTGLLQVIAQHPKGFELPIFEGGSGLSSGQRQLVALTRLILRNPNIWLLDEPTASIDGPLEMKILNLIKSALRETDTLIVVTHKPNILAIVDRIIVVNGGKIVLDGPRDSVIEKLSAPKNM